MSSTGSVSRNAAQNKNQRAPNKSNVSRAAIRVPGKASLIKAPAARSKVSTLNSLPKDNRTAIENAILGPGGLSDSEAGQEDGRNGFGGLGDLYIGNKDTPVNSLRSTLQIVQPDGDVPVDWQLQVEDLGRALDTRESEFYHLKQSMVDLQQEVIKTRADSQAARQASLFALIFLSLIPLRH
jgi:hypothetical protein